MISFGGFTVSWIQTRFDSLFQHSFSFGFNDASFHVFFNLRIMSYLICPWSSLFEPIKKIGEVYHWWSSDFFLPTTSDVSQVTHLDFQLLNDPPWSFQGIGLPKLKNWHDRGIQDSTMWSFNQHGAWLGRIISFSRTLFFKSILTSPSIIFSIGNK